MLGLFEQAAKLQAERPCLGANTAWELLSLGRPEEARAMIEPRAFEPGRPVWPTVLADAELWLGRFREAEAIYRRALAEEPFPGSITRAHTWYRSPRVGLAYALSEQGDLEAMSVASEARAIHEDWIDRHVARPEAWYNLAALDLVAGDTASALGGLEAAVQQGWRRADLARVDPLMSRLHGHPDFEHLMGQVDVLVDSMAALVRARDEAAGRFQER